MWEYHDNYDNDYNDYEQTSHSYQLHDDNSTTVIMETAYDAVNGLLL